MLNFIRRVGTSLLVIVAGLTIGYYLRAPLFEIPIDVTAPIFLPLAKLIDPYLSNSGMGYLTAVIWSFLLRVPNTFLLVLIAVLIIRAFQRARFLLYSVLTIPTLVFCIHWFQVWWFKQAAGARDPHEVFDSYPMAFLFAPDATLMLFTYSAFLILVVVIVHRLSLKRHNISVHTDSAPAALRR